MYADEPLRARPDSLRREDHRGFSIETMEPILCDREVCRAENAFPRSPVQARQTLRSSRPPDRVLLVFTEQIDQSRAPRLRDQERDNGGAVPEPQRPLLRSSSSASRTLPFGSGAGETFKRSGESFS